MDIKTQIKVENITITLNEDEAFYLKDIIEFALDYEAEHPNSLYTSEKVMCRELIDRLDMANVKKSEDYNRHKSKLAFIEEKEE